MTAQLLASLGSSLSGGGSFSSKIAGFSPLASAFGLGKKKKPSFATIASQNAKLVENTNAYGVYGKVLGAKWAGLHPLAALGSSTASPSVSINHDNQSPDLGTLGQGVDRALNAGRGKIQRELDNLALEKAKLSNDYLRTQIAGARQSITNHAANPALPDGRLPNFIPSSADSGIDVRPSRGTVSSSNRGIEKAITPANKIFVGYDGQPVLSPSSEYAETLEGNWPVGVIQNLIHNTTPWYRDRLKRYLRKKFKPKPRKNYTQHRFK